MVKRKSPSILTALLIASSSFANAQTSEESTLNTISIKDSSYLSDVAGFGDATNQELPLAAKVITAKEIQENRAHRMADLLRLDASTTDSYNAAGYWDYISIRGFTLDNRTNFLREGLPISSETSIALENKERVEILKGLSGIQAGTSAPGGMVNYVVKRPTQNDLRTLRTDVTDKGNVLVAADAGGRFTTAPRFGYRFNVAHEELRPHLKSANGSRSLISLANDWQINSRSVLETDIEWSLRSQPSQPGFSLLGNTLPDPVDPTINLNNQDWTQPVRFEGLTATARYSLQVSESLNWSTIVGIQNLSTDDYLAYPYGCSAENNYDRYCSDGTFDIYDYRSLDESRKTNSLKTGLQFNAQTGEVQHKLNVGILASSLKEDNNPQAYNYAGVGNVGGTAKVPAAPAMTNEGTNRESKVAELFVYDSAQLGAWKGWLGLRFSDVERSSIETDGGEATSFHKNFTTPWAALSYDFDGITSYISYGQGVEAFVTPNKPGYTNPGQFIPDVVSKQLEVGVKGETNFRWSAVAFHITRPTVTDAEPIYRIDGDAIHQGIELTGAKDFGKWDIEGSGMYLQATREGSTLAPQANGKKPVNVPNYTLRAQTNYQITQITGLALNARLTHEGERAVVVDNTIMLPAWTRLDAGVSYKLNTEKESSLRFAVDNIADTRYWKESPTQYGHIYLYPGEERTFSLSYFTNL
ncbi:TonB-dependent siderophore receptor [Bdellovibrio bacteriovorus]